MSASTRPDPAPGGEDATEGHTAPEFSVLIATYNQADYILDTLESVARQTCADYEVVIVNDGSTDDTEARVSQWTETFRRTHPNRVIFSTIENGGQSAAFEHGFGLCAGRYIALLDSDDRWLDRKLEAVAAEVRRDPAAGMIVHPLLVIDAQGNRTGDVRPMRAKLSAGDVREQVLRTGRQVAPATSGVVIRADVFHQLVPMPTKHFRADADTYLTLGASLLAPVLAMDEPLGEYRMHPEGHYFRRLTTPEGLRYSVELQLTVARHFGIEEAARRNSYFARNAFALSKLDGRPRDQTGAYLRLVRATAADPSFGAHLRAALIAYWTVCLVSPRPVFDRLWRAFQLRHTGHDRIAASAGMQNA
jgi:hypothetical protein